MTDCNRYRERIDDAAASGVTSDDLAAHVRECAACASALEHKCALLARADVVARAWMAAPQPAGMMERLLARIGAGGTADIASSGWRMALAAVSVAAAAVIVVAVAEVAQHLSFSSTQQLVAGKLADWHSPTAALLQPSSSVLDLQMPGRLLDRPRPAHPDPRPGGDHAG